MLVYATSAQLATWTGDDAPGNADQLLRSASLLLRRDTVTAVYDVDDDGLPTDADLAQAFQDAACAQAAAWVAASIDPTAGAATVTGTVTSSGIGTAKIDYGGRAGLDNDRATLATSLCGEALQILSDAGLLTSAVRY